MLAMALSTYIVTVLTYNDLIALLGGGAVCTVVVKFRFHELYLSLLDVYEALPWPILISNDVFGN